MDFQIGRKKSFNISINISSIEKKSELRLTKLTQHFLHISFAYLTFF